jgi:hypothetical protein
MALFDGRVDDARRYVDEVRRAAITSQHPGRWAACELGLCASTGDTERIRAFEHELTPALTNPILRAWQACAEAMLGRKDVARSLLLPASALTRGAPSLLYAAQTAVFLESAELAEVFYERLMHAAPSCRFFFLGTGPPIGPVSRMLGELALLRGDMDRAREHFDTAIAECREMEAVPFLRLAEEARARLGESIAARPAARRAPDMNVAIEREGDVWIVTGSTGAPFRVKHAKGMEYLDHLLRNPGREVYVLILGGAGEGPEDAGAILDERAKLAYKQRVEELEEQLTEAERFGDRGRAARAREELDAVAEQLASAVGLGGRDRKGASNVERARVNVQRRLKDAIRRIAEHDPTLGRYLDATVRTGTYCVYRPV